MSRYLDVFLQEFNGYGRYLVHEITHPSWHNYFYWLIGISLGVYALELIFPWRRDQARIRRDFWLDGFYMFFNFFLFSFIGYHAASQVVVQVFRDGLSRMGLGQLVVFDVASWPWATQLLVMFVLRDFIHWNVHRLLHRVPWLWEFHKVHHSVREMGFAAHLRYHWMETLVYRTLEYLPLALIGFGIKEFLIVHLVSLGIGHLNHANIKLPMGPLRYIFNHPQMHIWHHARDLPDGYTYGLNYGISLSLWDYLFATAYTDRCGRDIPLGFPGLDAFPGRFLGQVLYPWVKQPVKTDGIDVGPHVSA